jgi:predicted RNA binding protein YcfA (HicA-like mRNA interferase family)
MQFLVAVGGGAAGLDSRDIIRALEVDGWVYIGATGSHRHFKHPAKPGKVTVPHPRRDLHPDGQVALSIGGLERATITK